ncbi:MAG: hypothetical protein AB7L41_01195 [Flavobacteriaceae bacterium]
MGQVYFEFRRIGSSMRVAAVDAATGVEVQVVGPANASQRDLERLALAKLKLRLEREKSGIR